MSLRKLWNSLRGGSSETKSPAQPSAVTPDVSSDAASSSPRPVKVPAEQPRAAKPVRTAPSVAASTTAKVAPATEPVAETTPARRGVLSMLSRGENDALIKQFGRANPSSILEIGIGNGSRMPAILASVTQSGTESSKFKAIVIDEFEMAGGEVTMRDYHRQLAGLPIRPVIFPESVTRGLVNVAHRFGAVDMILIDSSVESAHAEGLAKYLGKVTHADTVVLSNAAGKWGVRPTHEESVRRAA
ncbi:hypothetical protein [Allorhodopirellula solitaria]|uniref:Uncharacterized protein n=1 Tax=Allorhodopirellula solitaria TaxID=2527987 RepID=A0A5C5XW13_9BACT|nr:hypothetical protein [Allorhodopirellula solitaria]TWT66185.1 hypothetical protein CA85_30490 [Allorhodopirellula solitaria]